MNSNFLFSITTGIYVVCFVLFLLARVIKFDRLNRPTVYLLTAGLVVQTVGFGYRIAEFSRLMQSINPDPLGWTKFYQYFPVTNLYESLVLFSWTMVVLFLILYWKKNLIQIAWMVVLLAAGGMAYATGLSAPQAAVSPLVPALKSNWLLFHVITCFLAYGAFGVAAALALPQLIRKEKGKDALGQKIDSAMYRVVLFGFLLLTVGIILGAVWANASWGSYWSWDPKETWSLITWLVYAGFLHARRTRGWVGRPAAIVVLIGFGVTIFTYLGVNLVLSGLHSYGSS